MPADGLVICGRADADCVMAATITRTSTMKDRSVPLMRARRRPLRPLLAALACLWARTALAQADGTADHDPVAPAEPSTGAGFG